MLPDDVLSLDIELTHPFPGLDQFTGFDVRGIVLLNGSKEWPSHGLTVPEQLQTLKSNLKKTKHFDQIAYYQDNTDCVIHTAGVLDFFNAFFTKNMSASAYGKMTRQISDHLPLWIEIDLLETALDQFIRQ